MKRLWVYFSLAFTTVIILAVLGIALSARLVSSMSADPANPPPPEVEAYLSERGMRDFPRNITIVAFTIGIVAIGAGIWMSRRLTKPLAELEEAALAIGRQELDRRVPVQGSAEFVAVATSFNEMAQLLAQEEELRRSLLADVAHELRHPIHILQGNLQAIMDGIYPLSEKEVEHLAEQTSHLAVLVNDLDILAQAEARQLPLSKQPTAIADLVKEAVAPFTSLAVARHINLRVELLGTVPEDVSVDQARIRQAVSNLLDNALRHTPDGGSITVALQRARDKLLISVADSGEGIGEAELPHIFDRFYRVDKARDRSAGSTGLGLAIVKATVEAHGGEVQVASAGPGHGSTFTVILPITHP